MARHVFMTGATGAIGPATVAQLLAPRSAVEKLSILLRGEHAARRFAELVQAIESRHAAPVADRLSFVTGDICQPHLGLDQAAIKSFHDVDVILHCAAETRFRAPIETLRNINIQGTAHLLAFAHQLPHLRCFVLCSTTCVAGTRCGRIPETASQKPPPFINAYEESKWQAESLVLAGGLPIRIVRLSTAIGERATGRIPKPGAFHHALQWIYRGLVPMVPADPAARVDFISTDQAAVALTHAVQRPLLAPDIWHIAAGDTAATPHELTDFIAARFRAHSAPWRHGQIAPPILTDGVTFDLFRHTVETSGDVLFKQVLDSVTSFLPGLLHPKIYDITNATAAGALAPEDWRTLLGHVIDHGLATAWGRLKHEEVPLV